MVGMWVLNFYDIPLVLDMREDGTGELLVDVGEELELIKKIEWGADGEQFCLARPTTDTGYVYELVRYHVSSDGQTVTFSDFQGFHTRRPRILKIEDGRAHYTRFPLRRYDPGWIPR